MCLYIYLSLYIYRLMSYIMEFYGVILPGLYISLNEISSFLSSVKARSIFMSVSIQLQSSMSMCPPPGSMTR